VSMKSAVWNRVVSWNVLSRVEWFHGMCCRGSSGVMEYAAAGRVVSWILLSWVKRCQGFCCRGWSGVMEYAVMGQVVSWNVLSRVETERCHDKIWPSRNSYPSHFAGRSLHC
jgi:hypothetical protein